MKVLAAFLFCFLSIFSCAQVQFGIKINAGASRFVTRFEISDPDYYQYKQKFPPMPSAQAGVYLVIQKSRHSFGTELVASHIWGKEVMTMIAVGSNGPTGQNIKDVTWRYATWLSVPLYYGFSFNKLTVNSGIQVGYLIKSGGRAEGMITGPNGHIDDQWTDKSDQLYIDKLDYGTRLGATWMLNNRITFEGNFYVGLNNLISDSPIMEYWTWHGQQLTFGIRYTLIPKPEVKAGSV